MPTYVYECKICSHRFEKFQSFSAEALTDCPECEEKALRKVLFPAGVVFKGSGFYVNDSRSPRRKASSTDSESGSGSNKKDRDKTSSKSSNGSDSGKKPAKSSAGKES